MLNTLTQCNREINPIVNPTSKQAYYAWCDSPFGDMLLVEQSAGLLALAFAGERGHNAVFTDIYQQLGRLGFSLTKTQHINWQKSLWTPKEQNIPLVFFGTDFQKNVWRTLLGIPHGHTVSYANIAHAIKRPKSVRAVGTAIGRNLLSWIVPCHRVLGSDHTLHGYRWGLSVKRVMLDWEKSALV